MSDDSSNQDQSTFVPPVSVFAGPIAELVGHRLLSPPDRPGLLATLARYEVLRVLGHGGMGVVLLARDSESGRDVALKMVRPELVPNQQMVHRFVKEAGHLQKLKHPNVVPVLEVCDRPQGPYFVMPYFEHGSLAQRIKPGQAMDDTAVLAIAASVAQGLQFAHRRGIIHRDLKPANILLGVGGRTCLADFGLARTMFNDTVLDVEREQVEGTAPYMSPGVAQGNAEDTRCDIYSFGALLYEMLTGDPPYVGRNTEDICRQILAGPPKPIRQRNPAADAGLAAVAEGAMARELRNRYADMTDVLADLERVKQDRPPVGPHGLVQRVRHIPGGVWLPVAAVVVALVWMLWYALSAPKPSAAHSAAAPAPPPGVATHLIANPVIANPAVANPVIANPAVANPVIANPVVANPVIANPVVANPLVARPVDIVKPPQPAPIVPPLRSQPIMVGCIGVAGSSDGLGTNARFSCPTAIAVDRAGYLYLADMGNNTIRKISPSGDVTTLAGLAGQSGQLNGEGDRARFMAPRGIAVDNFGNVYVAEFASDTIRKISPEGVVSLLAGSSTSPGWKDDKGDDAHFANPWSVTVDRRGNLSVADRSNFVIRKITPDGLVTTIAGHHGEPGFADGKGDAARFREPHGLAADEAGNIYVADTDNSAVRKISPAGEVQTIASVPAPESMAVDAKGAVYVTDSLGVHKITNGKAELLPPLSLTGNPDGPVAQADSIALDSRGTIYLVDSVKNIVCWQPGK